MNVSLKTYMPLIATSILTLSACTPLTGKYAKNLSDSEKVEIMLGTSGPMRQSKLDSIAYRKLFMQYNNDSSKVAEFNKIARNMRGYSSQEIDETKIKEHILESANSAGIDTQGLSMSKAFNTATNLQRKVNQFAYRKFFERIGLMNNEEFKKNFEKTSSEINTSLF